MIKLSTNMPELYNDLLDEIKLFYPEFSYADIDVVHKLSGGINTVTIDGLEYYVPLETTFPIKDTVLCKAAVYSALCKHSGKSMPWGSLTGIRPSKIVYDLKKKGLTDKDIALILKNIYYVSDAKIELLLRMIAGQKGYIDTNGRALALYINIPFCTTRCSYCSFVSTTIDRQKKYIPDYIDCLIREIEDAKKSAESSGLFWDSIYIGGGTPTSLEADDLKKVLAAASVPGIEFTCEAGRPDSITEEKLRVMKDYGVSRICINPQSLNNRTLEIIGRSHKAEDIYEKFHLAKQYGFSVNMDIIAGLEGEDIRDFRYTVDEILKLRPENLTVHTLSRKNGAEIKQQNIEDSIFIEDMLEYAGVRIRTEGYMPYYLYRQKSMMGNFENTGYTLPGYQCKNNISTMEETVSVLACGAGGISKRIFPGGRIERLANIKDVKLFVEQFDARMSKKRLFFDF